MLKPQTLKIATTGIDAHEGAAQFLAWLAYPEKGAARKRKQLIEAAIVSLAGGLRPRGRSSLTSKADRKQIRMMSARTMDRELTRAHKLINRRLELALTMCSLVSEQRKDRARSATTSDQLLTMNEVVVRGLKLRGHSDDRTYRRKDLQPIRPVIHMAIAFLLTVTYVAQQAKSRGKKFSLQNAYQFSWLVAHPEQWLAMAVFQSQAGVRKWSEQQRTHPALLVFRTHNLIRVIPDLKVPQQTGIQESLSTKPTKAARPVEQMDSPAHVEARTTPAKRMNGKSNGQVDGRNRTTGIEWTEHTWNPFVGCSIHTPGCTNCYAMRLAARIERMGITPAYEGTTRIANGHPVWTGRVNRSTPNTWRKPLSLRAPSRIFVNSMSDFFHENAPDEWRVEAIEIMRQTPRHSYQVLTKRPENIGPFLDRTGVTLPENFWAGATVERGDFVHRIDTLRRVPARIRFLSIEPLVGPLGRLDLAGIDWVIVGGESGPGARPMKFEWVENVIEQCEAQRVRTFLKQYGQPSNNPLWGEALRLGRSPAAYVSERDPIGKGGSTYRGREIKQYPAA